MLFFFYKKVIAVTLNKDELTADIDLANNSFLRRNSQRDFYEFKNN
ncbi:hypothetical protein [Pontimicrobium aquaticum]|nr:hypothetical protein [Pontimicrobium aquaticum]